ncbi:MAG: hypothetical protein HQK70_06205 [Desulfamplus sp.]|nr:hypothetical protein [Desulfamplus sp.]
MIKINPPNNRDFKGFKNNRKQAVKFIGVIISIITGLFTIVATSGDSGDSTVAPETPPAGIAIITPTNNQAFIEGDSIAFVSKISDAVATETYTYTWNSSLDGAVGTTANFNSATLTTGTHKITVTLSDSKGNTVDADSITVTVGDSSASTTPPDVTITAPAGDLTFNTGENITFTGSAKDSKGVDIGSSSLLWSSDIDGAMGTGTTITSNILSKGQHTITLTAKDSKGNSGSAFIIITIGEAEPSAPTVRITSPADSNNYTSDSTADTNADQEAATPYDVNAGDIINFVGNATDYDGTAITGEKLEWISSKDGKLFTGTEFKLNTRSVESLDYEPLKEGEHTIYLKATGSAGTAQAFIKIKVENSNPTAVIVNPPDTCPDTNTLCKTFAPGEFINFQGTATDAEDGNLSGKSLEWHSQIDGLLGTGESLNIKTDNVDALGNKPMTNGEHIITLEAKDEWGASGIDSVIINIGANTPPVPEIIYPPTTETILPASGFITFYGTARDAEDGSLTSEHLEWYSTNQAEKLSSQEVAGSGGLTSAVRVNLSNFAAGSINSITLVATDSMGSTGVTSRNIEIDEDGLEATITVPTTN